MTTLERSPMPRRPPEVAALDDAIEHVTAIIAAHVSTDPDRFAPSVRNAAIALLADTLGEPGPPVEPLRYGDRVLHRMPRHGDWIRGRIERVSDTHLHVRWDADTPIEIRGRGLARFPNPSTALIREPSAATAARRPAPVLFSEPLS